MTTFETSPTDLADALEAIRCLDLAAEECCRVDMRINPRLAVLRLEQIDRRRAEVRRLAEALVE